MKTPMSPWATPESSGTNMLHYSNFYCMDGCYQIDDMSRKINVQMLQRKKQIDTDATAWRRM